jgi:hypothetical protein
MIYIISYPELRLKWIASGYAPAMTKRFFETVA